MYNFKSSYRNFLYLFQFEVSVSSCTQKCCFLFLLTRTCNETHKVLILFFHHAPNLKSLSFLLLLLLSLQLYYKTTNSNVVNFSKASSPFIHSFINNLQRFTHQNAQQRPHTRSPRPWSEPENHETEPGPLGPLLRPSGPRKPHNAGLQNDLRHLLGPPFHFGPHRLHPLAQSPAPQAQVSHPRVQHARPGPKFWVPKRRRNVQGVRAKRQPEHRG